MHVLKIIASAAANLRVKDRYSLRDLGVGANPKL